MLSYKNIPIFTVALCLSFFSFAPAYSQEVIIRDGDSIPLPPPSYRPDANLTPFSPPAPTPPPVVFTPPPAPRTPFVPPIMVPTDVTNNTYSGAQSDIRLANAQAVAQYHNQALNGLTPIKENQFPQGTPKQDDPEGIVVKWLPESVFSKPQNNVVVLESGEILVSLKSPARHAAILTPFGKIALSANADVLVSYKDGVLRLKNMDGLGTKVMVKLFEGSFAGAKPILVSVAPGYEFIAADHKLNRFDLRPKDGIARRCVKLLEQGQIAISEFSAASAIAGSGVLLDLKQSVNGAKERRVLQDMTKMAAVLNYKLGANGFTSESEDNSRLAGKPGSQIN